MGHENLHADEQQYYSTEQIRTQTAGNGFAKADAKEIACNGKNHRHQAYDDKGQGEGRE